MLRKFAGTLGLLLLVHSAEAKTTFDFAILKKQLDQNGVYAKAPFEKLKKCVENAAKLADSESIGGIGLETPVKDIEKITHCKFDPKNEKKDERGLTIWNFPDCGLVVKFQKDKPWSILLNGPSKLTLKTKIGLVSNWKEAKKKYPKMDLRENPRDSQLYTPVCDIPDVCAFDYPTLSIRGDTYHQVVTQIELNRYSSLYCPGR